MFLGWYDPDRKKSARAKLADACERFEEKFGRRARFCLTSTQDASEIHATPDELPPGIESVQARTYIARWTFYVGEDGDRTTEGALDDAELRDAEEASADADASR